MKIAASFLTGFLLILHFTSLFAQTLPISRNWYRIPYANGTAITMGNDFVDHAGGVSGANAIDMWATNTTQARIVAAADGTITQIIDTRSGCRCASDASCGNNIVIIQHVNNEFSLYFHLVQNSVQGTGANQAGLSIGSNVTQGQFIGLEGDVGFTCTNSTTHPNGSTNRLPNLPCSTATLQANRCFQHLHFEVWRGQPFSAGNIRVNPKICTADPNIVGTNYIFDTGQSFTADACNSVCPSGAFNLPASESNIYRVYTASGFINSTQNIQSNAGIEYQANNIIRLLDGFRANAGAFFRAGIQNCSNPLPFVGDKPLDETAIRIDSSDAQMVWAIPEKSSQIDISFPPGTDKTAISYIIDENALVKLWVEDLSGQNVTILVDNEYKDNGAYLVTLDKTSYEPGSYRICLMAGEYQECRKLEIDLD